MLKDLDSRLTWLIVPISAFLFNPNQQENMLWALTAEMFFFCSTCTIASIFFLRRIKNKPFSLIPSILFATIAAFSNIAGLIVWVVGSFTFYFQRQKKLFSIWIISATTVFLIYFIFHTSPHYNYAQSTLFLSHPATAFSFIFLYVSNGLVINSQPLQILAGAIVLLLIIVGSIFLKFQKIEFGKIWPWVQLGLVGILAGIITIVGRIELGGPATSRYTTLANPAEISALAIGSFLFIRLLDSKRRKSVKITFSAILVITSIMLSYSLIVTYSDGWNLGATYASGEVTLGLHCMYKPDTDLKCGPPVYPAPNQLHNVAEVLLNLHLSPFSIPGYSVFSYDKLMKNTSWDSMGKIKGLGKIEYIDANDTSHTEKIDVKRELALTHATGWANFDNGIAVDSAYLFIDDNVNSRAVYGIPQNSTAIFLHHPDKTNRWISSIDLSKITSGCHKVSIRIVNDDKYYESVSSSQFCIN